MRKLLTPYKFQQEIINQIVDKDYFALFCETGVGKTLMSINVIREKYRKHGRVLRTLVLCPIIVLRNWKQEFLMSTHLPEENIKVIDAPTKQRRMTQLEVESNRVIIINYDALLTEDILDFLLSWKPEVIVIDESHKIKSRTARRTKAAMKLARGATYRYILSGTPITNNFQDLFSQYLVLDGGRTFGDNFFCFRNRYFFDKHATWKANKNYFPNWQFMESRMFEIQEKLNKTSVRIKKEDCLDLPEYVEQNIDFDLTTEQRKCYEQLKKEFITWLDGQPDNPLVVQNALVKMLRLNEITTGYARLEDDSVVEFKDNPRAAALDELLDSLIPHKIIIYAVYIQNYNAIKRVLESKKISYVELTGSVSQSQKLDNVESFNRGTPQVCIANPKSAGLGINLTVAKYKIYYSRNYSFEDFEQSKARNYRAGSIDYHAKITDYHLVARNTVDVSILHALKNKQAFASKILDIKSMLMYEDDIYY